MKNIFLKFSIMWIIILTISSCVREDDFSLDGVKGLNPTYAVPLINAELGINRLIHLTTDTIGTIYLEYNDDGDARIALYDTLTLSIASLKKKSTKLGGVLVPVHGQFDIDLFSNAVSGNLSFDLVIFDLWLRGRFDDQTVQEIPLTIQDIELELVNKKGETKQIDYTVYPMNLADSYRKLLTSNVASIFSELSPQTLSYSFNLLLDTASIGKFPEVLDVALYFGVDLRFSGGINFMDTVPFNLNISEDNLNDSGNSIEADLLYEFKNTFPFNMQIQLLFLDDSYVVSDSLFSRKEILLASDEGYTSSGSVSIGHERLKKINKLPYVVIQGIIDTENASGTPTIVQITRKDRLKILLNSRVKFSNLKL